MLKSTVLSIYNLIVSIQPEIWVLEPTSGVVPLHEVLLLASHFENLIRTLRIDHIHAVFSLWKLRAPATIWWSRCIYDIIPQGFVPCRFCPLWSDLHDEIVCFADVSECQRNYFVSCEHDSRLLKLIQSLYTMRLFQNQGLWKYSNGSALVLTSVWSFMLTTTWASLLYHQCMWLWNRRAHECEALANHDELTAVLLSVWLSLSTVWCYWWIYFVTLILNCWFLIVLFLHRNSLFEPTCDWSGWNHPWSWPPLGKNFVDVTDASSAAHTKPVKHFNIENLNHELIGSVA